MTAEDGTHRMETSRVEAFSDGVFAIAITLLILEVRLPDGGSLDGQLGRAWPSYVSYVISFVTIGIMWVNHHDIFRLIGRVSRGLLLANLALLLAVSFVPFPTKVLGEHLHHGGGDQRSAVVFYSASFFVAAVAYNVLWQVAAWRNRLIVPGAEAAATEVTRRFRYGAPSYLLAAAVALWQPAAGLAVDAGLAAFFVAWRPRFASEKPGSAARGRDGPQ